MDVLDVTSASNVIQEYEFSWTIENFSLSPNVVRGPSIPPTIPGFPENLCIELQYEECYYPANPKYYCYNLKMFLIYVNVKDRNLTVSSSTSFRNTNDVIYKEATTSSTEFKGSIRLMDYSYHSNTLAFTSKFQFSKEIELLEDKLVVKGKVSISSPAMASSVSSLLVKEESEAWGQVSKDFKAIYESGSSSDITFSFGTSTLRAHKMILLSRSPVFAKMFESDMSESNSNNVVIEDADVHAFNCFLMFLYTGIVENKKWDTVLSLYYLAHKYQVNSLHAVCSRILINTLAIDSVCRSLMLSDLHGDQELKEAARVFVRHHIIQIAGTADWIELASTKPLLAKEVLA